MARPRIPIGGWSGPSPNPHRIIKKNISDSQATPVISTHLVNPVNPVECGKTLLFYLLFKKSSIVTPISLRICLSKIGDISLPE